MEQTREALKPQVHDDDAVHATYDAISGDPSQVQAAFAELKDMLARGTGSIMNSYTKVQISSGVLVGIVALYLTVFSEQPGVNRQLLTTAATMEIIAIGLSFLVTTVRRSTFKHRVTSPGVYAATLTERDRYLALSKRVHHNRVVLLRGRRISWLAIWLLTLPGLVLAMWAWAWLATIVTLVIIAILRQFYKQYFGNDPHAGTLVYPSI